MNISILCKNCYYFGACAECNGCDDFTPCTELGEDILIQREIKLDRERFLAEWNKYIYE